MKKRFLQKLVAVATATTLMGSMLTGCGSQETQGENTSTGQESTTEEDPFAFDSVSDVTFPLKEKLTLDVFVYAANTGGGTMQDNYVTDWIEDQVESGYDRSGQYAGYLPGYEMVQGRDCIICRTGVDSAAG